MLPLQQWDLYNSCLFSFFHAYCIAIKKVSVQGRFIIILENTRVYKTIFESFVLHLLYKMEC